MLRIPAAPDFRSLNVAAAVQIVAYEVARAASRETGGEPDAAAARPGARRHEAGGGSGSNEARNDAVTVADLERLFTHFEAALIDIGYLDPAQPRLLMRRLRRLIARADPDGAELDILRGILAAAQRAARTPARSRSEE